MRLALALLLASFLGTPLAAQDTDLPPPALNEAAVPAVMEQAIDAFIRPGYETFLATTDWLSSAMDGLCAEPGPQRLEAARDAFGESVAAWSQIEIVRVGPAIENNRFERILFYPDRKSIGLKQVQSALAEADESATSAETLQRKSVAMQGLGALEFLLHGTGSEDLLEARDSYRCRYGMAVSANLKRLAGELADAWAGSGDLYRAWTRPGPDNPLFRTQSEAVTALLGILVHAAEAVRDQRIETFYKGPDARAAPRQAIYWRSGLTLRSIDENLAGIEALLHKSGMQDLLDPEVRSIVGSIDFVLKSMRRTARALDQDVKADMELAVSDEAARAKLDFLLLNGKDLILRLNDEYGGAIGLGSGFSFSDGD